MPDPPSAHGRSASVPESHRADAPKSVRCAVITVSDTRTEAEDSSGRHIVDALEAAGHTVELYRIVKDEPAEIRQALEDASASGTIRAVLINGGTGLAPRDRTYETIAAMIEKRMDGFGELFRMLSYEEIGAAAMLSRTVAGLYRGMIVFSMPGSTGAVRLAMEKLIVPELAHVVGQIE